MTTQKEQAECREFEPCPFCGCTKIFETDHTRCFDGSMLKSVGCSNCHVRALGHDEEARNKWNTRAEARPSQAAGGDALRDLVYDGYSVYCALSNKARRRTSSDNVSDVLDALAALTKNSPINQCADSQWCNCEPKKCDGNSPSNRCRFVASDDSRRGDAKPSEVTIRNLNGSKTTIVCLADDTAQPRPVEPVAWALQWPEMCRPNAMTTYSSKEKAEHYADECAKPDRNGITSGKPAVVPLYTAPQPGADACMSAQWLIEEFEKYIQLIPVGKEDVQRGASEYNWARRAKAKMQGIVNSAIAKHEGGGDDN